MINNLFTTVSTCALLCLPMTAHALGVIHTTVDRNCNWTTTDETDAVISTSPTLRDGIIEAQSTGYPYVADGNLKCPLPAMSPVAFGPASNQHYTLRNIVTTNSNVKFDTLYSSDLTWSGGGIDWTAGSTPSIVQFSPSSIVSGSEPSSSGQGKAFAWMYLNRLELPTVRVTGGAPTTMVYFDPTHAVISNNNIRFHGLDGGNIATNGIVVQNPTGDPFHSGFVQNDFDFMLITGFGTQGHGIQEGSGTINQSTQPLGTNTWRGGTISTFVGAYAAYQTFGIDSQLYVDSIVPNNTSGPSLQYGVFFSQGTSGNYALAPQLIATTPVVNQGGSNIVSSP